MHDEIWCLMKLSMRALSTRGIKHAKSSQKYQSTIGIKFTTHQSKHLKRARL